MYNEEHNNHISYPLKLGIDRHAIDFNTAICNFMKKGIYKREFDRTLYNSHPVLSRRIQPLFCYGNMIDRYEGVTSHLAYTCMNKSKGMIVSLKWFNDGKRLLTGTQLSELGIWNGLYFNFEDMKRIPLSAGSVSCLEWSISDNLFVGNSNGQILILSSALNLLDNYAYEGLNKNVMDIALSYCNTKLAACAYTCNPIIWDIKTRKVIKYLKCKNIDTNNITCLSWNPINNIISSGSTQIICFWDIRMNEPIISFNAHKSNIHKIKWNYDGKFLLSSSKDSLIKLWDIRNFKLIHYYKNHIPDNSILNMANINKYNNNYEPIYLSWNPIQNHIFACSDNKGSIKFFSTYNNNCIQCIYNAHYIDNIDKNNLILLDWNPLGHLLCSFGDDKLLKFWCCNSCDGIVAKEIDANSLINVKKMGYFPNCKYINEENIVDVNSDQSIYDSDECNYLKNKLNNNYYKKYLDRKKKWKNKKKIINKKLNVSFEKLKLKKEKIISEKDNINNDKLNNLKEVYEFDDIFNTLKKKY